MIPGYELEGPGEKPGTWIFRRKRPMTQSKVEEVARRVNDDFVQGYTDGQDLTSPLPGPNRSEAYRHSFDIGRREAEKREVPVAALSRMRANVIRSAEISAALEE